MNQQPVRTVKIKGRDYIDVAERVRLCNIDDGFSMLKEEYLEIAGQHIIRVYIDVKGKQYIGDAEIKVNARPGTADGDSPISCAQTSALGRALGFAGYGSLESIASADEVHRNLEQAAPKVIEDPKPETMLDGQDIPTVKELQKRCSAIFGVGHWQAMLHKVFKIEDPELIYRESDLTPEDRLKIKAYIDYAESHKAKAGEQPAA